MGLHHPPLPEAWHCTTVRQMRSSALAKSNGPAPLGFALKTERSHSPLGCEMECVALGVVESEQRNNPTRFVFAPPSLAKQSVENRDSVTVLLSKSTRHRVFL